MKQNGPPFGGPFSFGSRESGAMVVPSDGFGH